MNQLLNSASQSYMNHNAVAGSQLLLVADVDKIVTSTDMKVGAYTIAAQPISLARISVTVTIVDTPDTIGTITIVGTDKDGEVQTEVVTPIGNDTVYTENLFKTVTSVTGAGWVIDAAEGSEDTITVGVDYSQAPPNHYWCKLVTIAQAEVSAQTDKTGSITPDLTALTNLPALSVVQGKWTSISISSGEVIGYLAKS